MLFFTSGTEGGHTLFCTPVCTPAKSKIRKYGMLLGPLCDSVCLFGCQSPTGHNFKPIFTELHKMVELVVSKEPIDFEG